MTLYESADGLEKLESNGVTAYIDPRLKEFLANIGDIRVDYIDDEAHSGYTIKIGEGGCGDCKCS